MSHAKAVPTNRCFAEAERPTRLIFATTPLSCDMLSDPAYVPILLLPLWAFAVRGTSEEIHSNSLRSFALCSMQKGNTSDHIYPG